MKGMKLIILLLLLLVHRFSSEIKQLSPKSTTDVILTDIREAFKTVTNNTNLLNEIIPQMYESVMQQSKFVFLFEIPDDSVKDGYSMWSMERSDLVDPVFPNLTNEYMRTQLNKNRLTFAQNVNVNNDTSSTLKYESQALIANAWSTLGLHGWAGSIAAENVESDESNDYPASDILKDLNNEHGYENGAKEEDDNVYIARVNDPFGSSVKWELRKSSNRLKRDVLTLYSMIQCSTGCQPLIYKGYGCYCGFSGAGVPTDGIDRCCKVHDKCYEYSNCISYLEYFTPYIWKCYRRKPLCAIDHGEFGGPGSCAARLCQCDLQLSRCLRRFTCPRRRAVCYTSRVRRLQNFLFTI